MQGLHRSESGASESSSLTSPLPEFDPRRRGSAVSSSSMSQSPNGASYGYGNPRHSRSSFASSTGSPLASASLFSNGTTIGDLSTASMPLLPQGGGAGSIAPSTSSYRINADSSSAASISDASSIHSYPPPPSASNLPRSPGTPSARISAQEASHEHWLPWVREATGQQISPTSERGMSRANFGTESGYERRGSRSGSLGTAKYTASSSAPIRTSGIVPYSSGGNPLMPLRKRLARVLRIGRRGSVEVQLLLELIDGLENYIRAADLARGPSLRPGTSNDALNLTPPALSVDAFSVPQNPKKTTSASCSESQQASRQPCVDLLSEILSLVKELVEFVPDAQLCLTGGKYGPLAFSMPGTSPSGHRSSSGTVPLPILPASMTQAMVAHDLQERDRSESQWWPRRLSRDCRALLEDVGFSTFAAASARGSSSTGVATPGSTVAGLDGLDVLPNGSPRIPSLVSPNETVSALTAAVELEQALTALDSSDPVSTPDLTTGGLSGVDLAHHHHQQFDDPLSNTDSQQIRHSHQQGRNGAGVGAKANGSVGPSSGRESTAIAARRESLLVEGQKRWDAYRKRQAENV